MRESFLIIKRIESELKGIVKQTETKIMQSFPSLLSYDLITSKKYFISHDYDPPWDHSGNLFASHPNESFDVSDYETVEDFLDEYSGSRVATYISNYGLHHETYREKYIDWFQEQYRNAHFEYLSVMDCEVRSLLANDILDESYSDSDDVGEIINDLVNEIEEFEDLSFIHAENLCQKISEMDLLLLYKLGKKEANAQLLQEHIANENAARQITIEKDTFYKLWPLLEKKYRLAFQKPFPKRIEMSDFEPFDNFLDQHHVSKEERVLISKYAPISFSNSVFNKLYYL